jgi:hypothetical protein
VAAALAVLVNAFDDSNVENSRVRFKQASKL